MFCDKCHWYTAGEKICPHCGAEQIPPAADDIFGIRKPAQKPVPVPEPIPIQEPLAPVPEPPPPPPATAPAPKPAPVPAVPPKPSPIPVPPAPKPVPTPALPAPKPAPPTPDSSKQGLKVMAFVIIGAVVLMLVLLFADLGREEAYYNYSPDYNDSYFNDDDDFWITEPELPLWEAQVGDLVYYDDAYWRVLDEDEHSILLLLEDETYMPPEEIDGYLSEHGLFLLSPEEMEMYGVEPSEGWYSGVVPVRPAIWVSVR